MGWLAVLRITCAFDCNICVIVIYEIKSIIYLFKNNMKEVTDDASVSLASLRHTLVPQCGKTKDKSSNNL